MISQHSNKYSAHQVQSGRYQYTLQTLSNLDIPKEYCIYIYGTGKQTKGLYDELKKTEGVQVIWSDFILKGALKLLRLFVAGYAGIVKINNTKVIKDVFNKLNELSMTGIYIIDKKIENLFVNEIKPKILQILLQEWDPLNLKDHVKLAESEYESFVPQIVSKINNKDEIYKYLEQVERETYATGFNSQDIEHMAELYRICEKIFAISKLKNTIDKKL